MNIKIVGRNAAKIVITDKVSVSSLDSTRDAAILAETLIWNLSPDTLSKLLAYIMKRNADQETDKHVLDILKSGEPAVVVIYPDGNRAVMKEEEFDEMEGPDDDEGNEDYGIPDE